MKVWLACITYSPKHKVSATLSAGLWHSMRQQYSYDLLGTRNQATRSSLCTQGYIDVNTAAQPSRLPRNIDFSPCFSSPFSTFWKTPGASPQGPKWHVVPPVSWELWVKLSSFTAVTSWSMVLATLDKNKFWVHFNIPALKFVCQLFSQMEDFTHWTKFC